MNVAAGIKESALISVVKTRVGRGDNIGVKYKLAYKMAGGHSSKLNEQYKDRKFE